MNDLKDTFDEYLHCSKCGLSHLKSTLTPPKEGGVCRDCTTEATLVDRLRDAYKDKTAPEWHTLSCEAADEIERLRRIIETERNYQMRQKAMIMKAQAALEDAI